MKEYCFLYLLLLFPIIISAQAQTAAPPRYIHDKSGLEYQIYVNRGGARIEPGDFVIVNMVVKTDADSILQNTYATRSPVEMIVSKPKSNGDILYALTKLGEGDSALLKIKPDTMLKKLIKPFGFKGTYLNYYVKVSKVIKKGTLTSEEIMAKIVADRKIKNDSLALLQTVMIRKYIDTSKVQFSKTADTLYYDILKQGDGVILKPGETAVVNYTRRFLNGKLFDTSIKEIGIGEHMTIDPKRIYKPIAILIRKNQGPDFNGGLQLLSKGSKAIFILPSYFATEPGMIVVKPMAPIEFEVEVVDVKR